MAEKTGGEGRRGWPANYHISLMNQLYSSCFAVSSGQLTGLCISLDITWMECWVVPRLVILFIFFILGVDEVAIFLSLAVLFVIVHNEVVFVFIAGQVNAIIKSVTFYRSLLTRSTDALFVLACASSSLFCCFSALLNSSFIVPKVTFC